MKGTADQDEQPHAPEPAKFQQRARVALRRTPAFLPPTPTQSPPGNLGCHTPLRFSQIAGTGEWKEGHTRHETLQRTISSDTCESVLPTGA
jgi:hypothetical protein